MIAIISSGPKIFPKLFSIHSLYLLTKRMTPSFLSGRAQSALDDLSLKIVLFSLFLSKINKIK